MTVRTRFAPSPTGYLHIGGARTALFSWLYARRHGGHFVLRIEDTDQARSSEASVQAILDGMAWLGLDADEGPFYQTRRFDRYREVVQQLLDAGHAYRCYCTPEEIELMRARARARGEKPRYDGTWRDASDTPPPGIDPVVRFRNPLEGAVVIEDAVKGRISIGNAELDDLVLQRSDGSPTYNLSVVVDDLDMGITHVIRGDDHVNNTPRQINILQALGATPPVYAHLPMILGEDGKRMSKRHGAVSVMQYRDEGYLPDALINHLVRLGWSHGDQERFDRDEMIALFSLEAVNRAGAVFDRKKLDSINQHYLQHLPADRLGELLAPFVAALGIDVTSGAPLSAVADLLRDRAVTLVDMAASTGYFYRAPGVFDQKLANKQFTPASAALLAVVRDQIAQLDEYSPASIQALLERTVEQASVGFGKLGQPLRLAITGGGASPAMNQVLALIDAREVQERLDAAIARCGADHPAETS